MFKEEDVKVDKMFGHGGLFKTKGVGQRIAAAAMNSPVSVMETAGEGGAWGIALLADYMKSHVINIEQGTEDVEGFDRFMKRYMAGLAIEHAAVDALK